MSNRNITVIILTYNEEIHIERAIASVAPFAHKCIVVDSGSTDTTVQIAKRMGAHVLNHPWVNHTTQFNWALEQLEPGAEWILRLDADEIITDTLASEITKRLNHLPTDVNGIYVYRRATFLGRPIRWGGVYPLKLVRIFRYGYGKCEERWMDEHIIVHGKTATFSGEIVDDNKNGITRWIEKHNMYSSLEAIEQLNIRYGFMKRDDKEDEIRYIYRGYRRWIKENLYSRLPSGFRAVAYFLYRYICRLGFLDGFPGAAFHVLQGFWYRFLVDIKVYETSKYIIDTGTSPSIAIKDILGIEIKTNDIIK